MSDRTVLAGGGDLDSGGSCVCIRWRVYAAESCVRGWVLSTGRQHHPYVTDWLAMLQQHSNSPPCLVSSVVVQ